MHRRILFPLILFICKISTAQITLSADGPGNTYDLITSVLAPGDNPIETPDCGHSAFGDHIDEVYDTDLGINVFRFYIHVTPDDDRCINTDRQRNEIKSYDQSPDNLLGVIGEEVQYKWKFKLDAGFQSSSKFTHIHQLKAVGGTESSMPLITLTTRLGTPDKLQLRYAESTSQITWAQTDLTPFKGVWCEATETVTYGDTGDGIYSLEIKKVSDNSTLFSHSESSTRMWKTDADFVRPKWGIYRSLDFPAALRDEEVLFADFSIEELTVLPVELISFDATIADTKIELKWRISRENNLSGFEIQKSLNGIDWERIDFIESTGATDTPKDYEGIDKTPTFGKNYYRLKQIDLDGTFQYSDVIIIDYAQSKEELHISPNPTSGIISITGIEQNTFLNIYDIYGRKIKSRLEVTETVDMNSFPEGTYLFVFFSGESTLVRRIIKK